MRTNIKKDQRRAALKAASIKTAIIILVIGVLAGAGVYDWILAQVDNALVVQEGFYSRPSE